MEASEIPCHVKHVQTQAFCDVPRQLAGSRRIWCQMEYVFMHPRTQVFPGVPRQMEKLSGIKKCHRKHVFMSQRTLTFHNVPARSFVNCHIII